MIFSILRFASHRGIYLSLAGSGGHEPVQLRVLGEAVHKGQNHVAIEQKPLPLAGVGDVRDPQLGVKISSINFSDKAVEDFNFLLPVAVLVFGSRMNDNFVNQGIQ